MNDPLGPLLCAACRHELTVEDAVHTVGGRRFHTDCVDAHRADPATSRRSLGLFARYIERFSQVLRR